MKRSGLILTLGAMNALLLAIVLWQATWARHGQVSAEGAAVPAARATGSGSAGLEEAAASDSSPPPVQQLRVSADPVAVAARDWRQIESADYRTYIQNLRALGCPEQTVRDIVTADVAQNFAARRRAAAAEVLQDFAYWETGLADARRRAALTQRQQALGEEMGGVLRTLLGADTATPDARAEWRVAVLEQHLAFLPTEKQAPALAALQRYADGELQIPHAAGNRLAVDQAEDLQRRLELFDRKRQELATVLIPEEFERVELTTSWTADNLRRAMANFQPTEAEFRAIFQEWRAHDERIARRWAAGEPDPGNASVFEAIREQLGEQRFAQYRGTWWK